MKVNIVMLVKGRPKLTNQTMRTLFSNTPKDLYNITIIDDGSEGDYLPARDFALLGRPDQTAYLTITNSKGITGQARNLGIYWAEKYWGRGDYLMLCDNDLYFTPKWYDRLLSCFETLEKYHNCQLLGAWNHPFLQPKDEGIRLFFTDHIHFHDAVAGASQLMKWETWDKYGPLDAHAKGVGQSEDWAFCQKIIKDGGKVGSIYPRVVFNCGVTNSFGQPSPGADVMTKELIEAKRHYPDLYWE